MLNFSNTHTSSFYNLSPEELVDHTISQKEGTISNKGALCIQTGKFTGRSPKDRFIVSDNITKHSVDWGEINQPFNSDMYNILEKEVISYLSNTNLYIQDGYAGADSNYQLSVKLYAEKPWSAHFFRNMFLRPGEKKGRCT